MSCKNLYDLGKELASKFPPFFTLFYEAREVKESLLFAFHLLVDSLDLLGQKVEFIT